MSQLCFRGGEIFSRSDCEPIKRDTDLQKWDHAFLKTSHPRPTPLRSLNLIHQVRFKSWMKMELRWLCLIYERRWLLKINLTLILITDLYERHKSPSKSCCLHIRSLYCRVNRHFTSTVFFSFLQAAILITHTSINTWIYDLTMSYQPTRESLLVSCYLSGCFFVTSFRVDKSMIRERKKHRLLSKSTRDKIFRWLCWGEGHPMIQVKLISFNLWYF